MDYLCIKSLEVATKIGVYPWEQRINQKLFIDLSIPSDFSECKDDLNKTVDYERLCFAVTEYVEGKAFQLIESVAEEVAGLIRSEFKIASVTVTVCKPHAIKNAANVQVTVTR